MGMLDRIIADVGADRPCADAERAIRAPVARRFGRAGGLTRPFCKAAITPVLPSPSRGAAVPARADADMTISAHGLELPR